MGLLDIFIRVKDALNRQYNIGNCAGTNRAVAMKLMYYCIEGIAIDPNECLDDNNKDLTIRSLGLDNHIILSSVGGYALLICPSILFVYIMTFYVLLILNLRKSSMMKNFIEKNGSFSWHTMKKNALTLRQLYPGADLDVNFDMSVKLKPLRVCAANEQFPDKTELTDKHDGKSINWKSGDLVVVNDKSAPFADVFLLREGQDTDRTCIIMNQCKWDYGQLR
ncbi:hypothetical protein RclHR1_00580036 [Rhizophagus clarus]|uniref:Uncharacterized protein n=1 Tax=Rhizophagus clarus TaxID=94130 RepID=A0A2Z6RQU9_9GLOM|nr:hypothetical protein RclHR1_00580036 [Rhizophagus clarus]GES92161.1 hypothetical protein GLOIN_2v1720020 [Rhizophagus clarus]